MSLRQVVDIGQRVGRTNRYLSCVQCRSLERRTVWYETRLVRREECSGGNGRSSNRAASFNPSGYEELGVMSTAGRGLRGWMDRAAGKGPDDAESPSRFYVYGHGGYALISVACELRRTHGDTNERRRTKRDQLRAISSIW